MSYDEDDDLHPPQGHPIEWAIRRIKALDFVTPKLEGLHVARDNGNRKARELLIAYNKCYDSWAESALVRLERAVKAWQQA